MKADYTIHSGWGDHIDWNDPKEFSQKSLDKDTFGVNGHLPIIPQKGDTLLGEFEKSFIKFKFVEVERCLDPNDMFFGTVKAIQQEMKR